MFSAMALSPSPERDWHLIRKVNNVNRSGLNSKQDFPLRAAGKDRGRGPEPARPRQTPAISPPCRRAAWWVTPFVKELASSAPSTRSIPEAFRRTSRTFPNVNRTFRVRAQAFRETSETSSIPEERLAARSETFRPRSGSLRAGWERPGPGRNASLRPRSAREPAANAAERSGNVRWRPAAAP